MHCLSRFGGKVTSSSSSGGCIISRLLFPQYSEQLTISNQRRMTSNTTKNPYRILGLPPNASYPTIQKKFLQLAMEHHPDTRSSSLSSSSKSNCNSEFVQIRSAFEQLRKEHIRQQMRPTKDYNDNDDDDGNSAEVLTEEDFLDWFHQLTGVRLTSEQRREMILLYWNQHQRNGDGQQGSHGHSWDLARRLVYFQDVFLRNMERSNGSARGTAEKDPRGRSDSSTTSRASASRSVNLRRKKPPRR
eukprot:scaffold834_cov123-Cylindrotheca_fusiformis.AAC.13